MFFSKISLQICFVTIFRSGLLFYSCFGFNLMNFQGWKSKSSNLQSHQLKIKEAPLNINVKHKQDLNYEKYKREWYFSNGKIYPLPNENQNVNLFPDKVSIGDRIINQLMFVPKNYQKLGQDNNLKKILIFNGLDTWNKVEGRDVFLDSKCPVDTCTITKNIEKAISADLILYDKGFLPTGVRRHKKQIYMLHILESPTYTDMIEIPKVFNWTATYRRDSDIAVPYGKWVYYDNNIKQMDQNRNYAVNKTKQVAWFVSNCQTENERLEYAHELQQYIEVDIYGQCGTFNCSRDIEKKCFEILDKKYKFYLAFENSNCKDYITEKFFINALQNNILPIVMGARPEDYENSAPYKSYIHVNEFSSVKELADYLHILDRNDELYNSYFKWQGTGEFINNFFLCRICALLHDDAIISIPSWHENIGNWWHKDGICNNTPWRSPSTKKKLVNKYFSNENFFNTRK